MRVRINNGHVVDPANGIDGPRTVCIQDGRIAAVAKTAPADFTADRNIDAQGCIVCPGFIDLATHLREPGQEYLATIASETRAAAAGGFTSLCCPPDTNPPIDTPAVAELVQQRAEQAGHARVYPLGALTAGLDRESLSEMAALKNAGCPGVADTGAPARNLLILRRALEYAATHDLTVFLHPEDPDLRNGGYAHEGEAATHLGLPGIPAAAETASVAASLEVARKVGARLHFCRLSTARAVGLVARAQQEGQAVTADVAMHHLHLCEWDLEEFDSQYHALPPFRSETDRAGLCEGVANGTVAAICSDHQPYDTDAKCAPFMDTAPGLSALETVLPLGLRLVEAGVLSLSALIARLTSGPADILGLATGRLDVGAPADLCLFDPQVRWCLSPDQLLSRGHNTPFLNEDFSGRVILTLKAGRPTFELSECRR